MKTLLSAGFWPLLWFFLTASPVPRPERTVLCHDPAVSEPMAVFVSDPAFIAAHAAPAPSHAGTKGKKIQLKAADGTAVYAVEFKAEKPTENWLIVIHEWWGLNDWVVLEAERYFGALEQVNVLALDMYDGKLASQPEEAGKLMQAMNQDRGETIVRAALAHAGKKARIATVGWCFGGGWSLRASLLAEKRAKACVMYYGMPVDDVNVLKRLSAPVFFVLARQDAWITPEVVSRFENNMKAAGRSIVVSAFDADHAFANPSNPWFKADLATKAFEESTAFIRKGLN